MSVQWRIELFGGLRAENHDRVVTRFRTQKASVLLAYLACYRDRSHPREKLLGLLWQDFTPQSGRNNLNVTLSTLRSQLEPPGVPVGTVISADRFNVQLNPRAVATDLADFQQALRAERQAADDAGRIQHLARAADLYRGELLSGFYDEWVEKERRHLAETYLSILRRLIRLLAKSRDFERALDYAQRALRADLLDEKSHRDLMRLYAAMGRPAAALQQYRELERLLKEHLDDEPLPATRELARAI